MNRNTFKIYTRKKKKRVLNMILYLVADVPSDVSNARMVVYSFNKILNRLNLTLDTFMSSGN